MFTIYANGEPYACAQTSDDALAIIRDLIALGCRDIALSVAA